MVVNTAHNSVEDLQIADSSAVQVGTANFTLEAMIYPTGTTIGTIFSKYPGGATNRWQLHHTGSNGEIGFGVQNSGGGAGVIDLLTANGVAPLNQWSHVALVRTGSVVSLLVNGVVRAQSAPYNDSVNLSIAGAPLGIGFWVNATVGYRNGFTGYIDNARLTKGIARY
jgi:hypothetical protein